MQNAQASPTYIIAAIVLFVLSVIHLFGIYPLVTDKFSFFLVSLFIAVMLLPLLRYLKFFDLIEFRKQSKVMKK